MSLPCVRWMLPVLLSALASAFSAARAAQLPPSCNLEVSASGPGGPFPVFGTGDGVFPTTLPSSPLISTLAFNPSGAVTEIDAVRLFGLSHTFIGDLQFVLVDPNGTAYNLITRLGGYSCDFDGDYRIAAPCACSGYGQTLPATCTGLNVLPNGPIEQWFGAWPHGANGIFNTSLELIPPTSGVWALVIFDWASGDVGTLVAWDIVCKTTSTPGHPPRPPNGCDALTLKPSTPLNNTTQFNQVTLNWGASASPRGTTHRVRRKKDGDPDQTAQTTTVETSLTSELLPVLDPGWWHWDVSTGKWDSTTLSTLYSVPSQPCRFCIPDTLLAGVCSMLGAGGSIPPTGSGDGAWPGTLPSSPLVSTISISVPAGATEIARLELNGVAHTRIGDLHVVLTDPSGGAHNILHRVGHTGSGAGSSCDLLGSYSLGKLSQVICPRWSAGCAPLSVLPPGDYEQDFGSWPSGTNGIFNTPIEFIPLSSGNWTLTIYDWAAGNIGSITSWRLCFDVPSAPVNYCTAGTTANGCNASISASAQPSASLAAPCTIGVANVEGAKQGLILYGLNNTGFTPSPWGAGGTSFLCVKSPTQRTGAQASGGTANACDGALTLDWNTFVLTHPTAIGVPFSAGDKLYMQAWFRDPPAPKTSSLSDALELTVIP